MAQTPPLLAVPPTLLWDEKHSAPGSTRHMPLGRFGKAAFATPWDQEDTGPHAVVGQVPPSKVMAMIQSTVERIESGLRVQVARSRSPAWLRRITMPHKNQVQPFLVPTCGVMAGFMRCTIRDDDLPPTLAVQRGMRPRPRMHSTIATRFRSRLNVPGQEDAYLHRMPLRVHQTLPCTPIPRLSCTRRYDMAKGRNFRSCPKYAGARGSSENSLLFHGPTTRYSSRVPSSPHSHTPTLPQSRNPTLSQSHNPAIPQSRNPAIPQSHNPTNTRLDTFHLPATAPDAVVLSEAWNKRFRSVQLGQRSTQPAHRTTFHHSASCASQTFLVGSFICKNLLAEWRQQRLLFRFDTTWLVTNLSQGTGSILDATGRVKEAPSKVIWFPVHHAKAGAETRTGDRHCRITFKMPTLGSVPRYIATHDNGIGMSPRKAGTQHGGTKAASACATPPDTALGQVQQHLAPGDDPALRSWLSA
ncbi:hypothetical protein PMIN01_12346 [Paraphaeosphaeria minitans]|uniref:Uncharacterized protein n=1 Tax=Paraphaeosphaeria minitans TaxID=565426 RepID=A0A9P6G5H9_9PLEO|nr:hypothetical protein PMIN01_12346 [Paraphaeosphaeria minitans]